ncbi:MAG TPA: site-specific integrase [Desulfovibrio sp.]|uniref:site-specific integrase n=1 Tax=Desulfovibrio sp. TaxID=885 RepID=UPI002C4F21F3|nr:site-specific integrase [Desulfovibrio sp.]HMM37520.1 site-specific integrase [Desulfovibrio sp.]
MATFQKRANGKWQVKIRRDGQPSVSKTFTTKSDAEKWARAQEREMDRGAFLPTDAAERTSVAAALDRYQKEAFPRLARGGNSLTGNLARLRSGLGALSLLALDSSHVAAYRDKVLKSGLSPQTVRHDLGLLHRVLKHCTIDWGISLPRGLPVVRMPSMPRSRDRRLERGEEEKLHKAATAYGGDMADIITFALETAMRRTELARMRWEHVDLKNRVALLPETKNGDPREVPLSPKALAILKTRRHDLGPVWRYFSNPNAITQAFIRICQRGGLPDLRYHDLRHEATSRLFEKGLNMMEVAAITGHKTLDMLKRYTHLRASDLASRLAKK